MDAVSEAKKGSTHLEAEELDAGGGDVGQPCFRQILAENHIGRQAWRVKGGGIQNGCPGGGGGGAASDSPGPPTATGTGARVCEVRGTGLPSAKMGFLVFASRWTMSSALP